MAKHWCFGTPSSQKYAMSLLEQTEIDERWRKLWSDGNVIDDEASGHLKEAMTRISQLP